MDQLGYIRSFEGKIAAYEAANNII
jgi:hypothetical protein